MRTCALIQGALFLLLMAGVLIFPLQPAVGFLMAAGAIGASSLLPASTGEALELVVFYGALAGILIGCM